MKTPRKASAVPDIDYVRIMEDAAKLHVAVAPMAVRLGDILRAIIAREIRRPNNWQFCYTGYVELRWYDGGKPFPSSTRWVGMDVFADDNVSIRGRLEKSYDSACGLTIKGAKAEEAITMLKILVELVGAP